MIALVGLDPPPEAGSVRVLSELPPPPALQYHGFFVRCCDAGSPGICVVLDWFARVRADRPEVPLALVSDATGEALRALAGHPYRVRPVLTPGELEGRRLPDEALDALRSRSVHGRILEAWLRRIGPPSFSARPLLSSLVSHGIRGGTVAAAARDLHLPPREVAPALEEVCSSCRPKCLMNHARVQSVLIRRASGAEPAPACAAAGFSTPTAFHKAVQRQRHREARCKPLRGGCPFRGCKPVSGG